MSLVAPWQTEMDESYWNAIMVQGRWVEGTPPPNGEEALAPVVENRFAAQEIDRKWQRLQEMFDEGTVVCLAVTGFNKGGLLVEWEGLQGFVPISQLMDAPVLADDCERMDCLATHVDKELQLKVIELERVQNRIIFSERAAQWGDCCPDKLLENLRAGDTCEGTVSNLCDFGVFVDLGGIDGLIHVSELSWRRVNHPRDVLQVGRRIRVHVIDVDNRRRRIALSLKRLQANPWSTVAERYRPGMIVEGVVTNVVEFGVFACIEDGVEGLIHVSELFHNGNPVQHPAEVIREGERIQARILSVDPDHQRMALSLRGVTHSSTNGNGAAETASAIETTYPDGTESP